MSLVARGAALVAGPPVVARGAAVVAGPLVVAKGAAVVAVAAVVDRGAAVMAGPPYGGRRRWGRWSRESNDFAVSC